MTIQKSFPNWIREVNYGFDWTNGETEAVSMIFVNSIVSFFYLYINQTWICRTSYYWQSFWTFTFCFLSFLSKDVDIGFFYYNNNAEMRLYGILANNNMTSKTFKIFLKTMWPFLYSNSAAFNCLFFFRI